MQLDNKLERKISYVLKTLGMRPGLLGYHYTKLSVAMIMEDWMIISHVTRDIYPEVAKICKTTASRVERAIRHAIESAYDNTDPDLIEAAFGNTISMDKGKLTNSDFLASVAELVKLIEVPETFTKLEDLFDCHVREEA